MLKIVAIGVLCVGLLQSPHPVIAPISVGCAYRPGGLITVADVYGDIGHLPRLLWDPSQIEINHLVVMEFDSGSQHIVAVNHGEKAVGGELVFTVSYRSVM